MVVSCCRVAPCVKNARSAVERVDRRHVDGRQRQTAERRDQMAAQDALVLLGVALVDHTLGAPVLDQVVEVALRRRRAALAAANRVGLGLHAAELLLRLVPRLECGRAAFASMVEPANTPAARW